MKKVVLFHTILVAPIPKGLLFFALKMFVIQCI